MNDNEWLQAWAVSGLLGFYWALVFVELVGIGTAGFFFFFFFFLIIIIDHSI